MKKRLLLVPIILLAVLILRVRAKDDFVVAEHAVVFQHVSEDSTDPQNRSGFNHGPNAVLLPDGRVMAAWFSGPYEGAPSQRIMQSFSSDGGRTWSAAAVLQDFADRADFDPSFVVSGKRLILFFAATQPTSVYMRCSDDSGATWSPSVELGQSGHTLRANGIRLATGELLVPLHRTGTRAGGVLKSTDDGATWRRCGDVANPAGQGGEPTIAQLPSGRVLMILRTRDEQVWHAFSDDRGETWSEPESIAGLHGVTSASHLLQLRGGPLVLARNPGPGANRFPLVLQTSRDEGRTWSEPFKLADRPENVGGWSECYPSLVELPDDTLLAVWTQLRSNRNIQYGDIQCARLMVKKSAERVR